MSGLRVQLASFNANLQGAQSTRPDLTRWLVPTVDQASSPAMILPVAVSSHSAPVPAQHFRSANPQTPSAHPSLPREAPDFYAVGFQELVPLHTGFAATSAPAFYNIELDIRKTIRNHQAIVSGNAMYAEPQLGGGPESYALLTRVDMVGIALYVYARERPSAPTDCGSIPTSAAARVREIRKTTVGTGLGGLMGNKGAVGVRIVVSSADAKGPDEALTFVCAHLAAHDHNVERRNQDWKQIVQRLVFAPSSATALPIIQETKTKPTASNMDALQQQYQAANSTQVKAKQSRKPKPLDNTSYTLYDTTHLFVFGDLNHRIALGPSTLHGDLGSGGDEKSSESSSSAVQPLTKDRLASLLESCDWASLQPHDQLTNQRLALSSPKAFHALTELSIKEMDIPPTYKYKIIRDDDESSSKKKSKRQKTVEASSAAADKGVPLGQQLSKKRVPGWTDRILWASAAAGGPVTTSSNKTATPAFHRQGVEVELYRSVMEMTHSDHKPITTLLRLPVPQSSSSASLCLLSSSNPYPPLSALHRWILTLVGLVLDRTVGYAWTGIIFLGGGNLIGGLVELFVLGAITAWWLGRGGGGGDLSWWIYGSTR